MVDYFSTFKYLSHPNIIESNFFLFTRSTILHTRKQKFLQETWYRESYNKNEILVFLKQSPKIKKCPTKNVN